MFCRSQNTGKPHSHKVFLLYILFKNELFNSFIINAVDKTYDGILGVKFEHKFTDYTFIVISCYHLKIHHGVVIETFCHT